MKASGPSTLGAAIRARRQHLRLSQQALAELAGVNRRVVGELERGKQTVQLRIALRIARTLGLDLTVEDRES